MLNGVSNYQVHFQGQNKNKTNAAVSSLKRAYDDVFKDDNELSGREIVAGGTAVAFASKVRNFGRAKRVAKQIGEDVAESAVKHKGTITNMLDSAAKALKSKKGLKFLGNMLDNKVVRKIAAPFAGLAAIGIVAGELLGAATTIFGAAKSENI